MGSQKTIFSEFPMGKLSWLLVQDAGCKHTFFLLLISLQAPMSRHCSKYQNARFLRGQVCPAECFHAHSPFQDKQRELYSFEL